MKKILKTFLICCIFFAFVRVYVSADSITYFSPQEAKAFIGFIYNTNELTEEMMTSGNMYDFLTGKKQGAEDEELCKMIFLATSYDMISKNISSASSKATHGYDLLLDSLMELCRMSEDGTVTIGISTTSVKRAIVSSASLVLGADSSELTTLSNLFSGIVDFKGLNAKVSKIVTQFKACLGAAELLNSAGYRDMYSYYLNYIEMKPIYGISDEIDAVLDWVVDWNKNSSISGTAQALLDKVDFTGFTDRFNLNWTSEECIAFIERCGDFTYLVELSLHDTSNDNSSNENTSSVHNSYNITFNSNCNHLADYSYVYVPSQNNWHIPTMTRAGYIFQGWYWDLACSNPVDGTIVINKDLTFYAKWVPIYSYTVAANGNATITGLLHYKSGQTTFVLPSSIDGHKVTEIGEKAFYKIDLLVAVNIPDTVIKINNAAFRGCDNLTSIALGDNLSYIGGSAFSDCTSLESIVIPASVTSIGSYVFSGCDNLESVIFEENSQLKSIADYAFAGFHSLSIQIPASVTSMGKYAFKGSGIESITFEENSQLTSIAYYTFYECDRLRSIVIPASVTSIGEGAFMYCTSLQSVIFEENSRLSSIGWRAFDNSTSLESIEIPASVTSIGRYALTYCSHITVNSNNTKYSNDEHGVLFNKNKTTLVQYPANSTETTYEIPASVTSILGYAFYACDSLESVTFEENSQLASIANSAFAGSWSLKSIEIPDSVTSIGEGAFSGSGIESITFEENSQLTKIGDMVFMDCHSLSSIQIPEGVTKIGEYTFMYCTSLESIQIPASVTNIDGEAFAGCNSFTIYGYPGSYAEKYRNFISNIQTYNGASFRVLNNGNLGLRFRASAMYEVWDNEKTEIGFIIAKKTALGDTELKFGCGVPTVYGVAKLGDFERIYDFDDTSVHFTGVLTGIPSGQEDCVLVGRPYVKLDGVYYYGDPIERSVLEVARAAKADTETFETYSQELKAAIERIIAIHSETFSENETFIDVKDLYN